MKRNARSEKIVCDCLQITEADLRAAFQKEALHDLRDVIRATRAGEGCTACHPVLRDYLKRRRGYPSDPSCSER